MKRNIIAVVVGVVILIPGFLMSYIHGAVYTSVGAVFTSVGATLFILARNREVRSIAVGAGVFGCIRNYHFLVRAGVFGCIRSLRFLWDDRMGVITVIIAVIISVAVGVAFWFIYGKLTKKGTGFYSPKETCAICGKEVGLNRFLITRTFDGKCIWKCPECTRKGGELNVNRETGEVILVENKDTETRMKCNVCGHIYCYTLADLERNIKLAKGALSESLLGVGEALSGTRLGSQVASARAESKRNQIVDYKKCPHCHSVDVREMTEEEWKIESTKKAQAAYAPVSSADELKKYKELLDMGVITQEEFDAKKKQLLGL